jgi:hypothetical protein
VNQSVKRIIALTALWLCAAFSIAQAPIGVCLNNVAQTISNGVIAPIPYATVALCTPGSTASNCIANKVNIFTSTALSTATPTNPFTADAGGNYFFCAAVGHYGVLISSSYGTYFVNDFALVDDWSKGGTMTGALTDTFGFVGPLTGNVTGNVSGNAGTASASNHTPTQCGSGLYSQGDTPSWAANCAQVLWSQLGSIPSFYYQTVQEVGSALAQQAVLNFDGTVAATPGTGKTNVGLPSVGTPGTYTNPSSITTDAQGRVAGVTSTPATGQTNCLTSVCAGGSTYASGVTYTNSSGHRIFEEVSADYANPSGSCVGQSIAIVALVDGLLAGQNSITNDCGPNYTKMGVPFMVPAGSTFSVTVTWGGDRTGEISGWLELPF